LCRNKIEEAAHEYFGEVLPTESTPWGVIAMKKNGKSQRSPQALSRTRNRFDRVSNPR
jgi:hypothetical protein